MSIGKPEVQTRKLRIAKKRNLSQDDIDFLKIHYRRCGIYFTSRQQPYCDKCGRQFMKNDIVCTIYYKQKSFLCKKCYNSLWISIEDEED